MKLLLPNYILKKQSRVLRKQNNRLQLTHALAKRVMHGEISSHLKIQMTWTFCSLIY